MKAAVYYAALATAVSPAVADTRYDCRIGDNSGAITCLSDSSSISVFDFKLNVAVPVKSSLIFDHPLSCGDPEEYRFNLEGFRNTQLERFRVALEGLRDKAESLRSSADSGLYQELINRYTDLMKYYNDGQRSYLAAIQQYNSCWRPSPSING